MTNKTHTKKICFSDNYYEIDINNRFKVEKLNEPTLVLLCPTLYQTLYFLPSQCDFVCNFVSEFVMLDHIASPQLERSYS